MQSEKKSEIYSKGKDWHIYKAGVCIHTNRGDHGHYSELLLIAGWELYTHRSMCVRS